MSNVIHKFKTALFHPYCPKCSTLSRVGIHVKTIMLVKPTRYNMTINIYYMFLCSGNHVSF